MRRHGSTQKYDASEFCSAFENLSFQCRNCSESLQTPQLYLSKALAAFYCDLLCVLSLEKALEAVREREDLGGGKVF